MSHHNVYNTSFHSTLWESVVGLIHATRPGATVDPRGAASELDALFDGAQRTVSEWRRRGQAELQVSLLDVFRSSAHLALEASMHSVQPADTTRFQDTLQELMHHIVAAGICQTEEEKTATAHVLPGETLTQAEESHRVLLEEQLALGGARAAFNHLQSNILQSRTGTPLLRSAAHLWAGSLLTAAPAHSCRCIPVLVAGPSAGYVVQLLLERLPFDAVGLVRGPRECLRHVDKSFSESIAKAWRLARGRRPHGGVAWALSFAHLGADYDRLHIKGDSAMAAAMAGVIEWENYNPDWLITATVAEDGRLGRVGSEFQKCESIKHTAGSRRVILANTPGHDHTALLAKAIGNAENVIQYVDSIGEACSLVRGDITNVRAYLQRLAAEPDQREAAAPWLGNHSLRELWQQPSLAPLSPKKEERPRDDGQRPPRGDHDTKPAGVLHEPQLYPTERKTYDAPIDWPKFLALLDKPAPRLAVVGPPGMGKSSLATMLAAHLASVAIDSLGQPDKATALPAGLTSVPLPIIVRVKQLPKDGLPATLPAEPKQALAILSAYLANEIRERAGDATKYLLDHLDAPNTILILDGLDEATTPGDIERLLAGLRTHTGAVVVTARGYGFTDATRRAFLAKPDKDAEYHLMALTPTQREHIAAAYFPADAPNADAHRRAVLDLLRPGSGAAVMGESGLLVTMLCYLVWLVKPVGRDSTRAKVYELLIEALLQPDGHWPDFLDKRPGRALAALAAATWEAFERNPAGYRVESAEAFCQRLEELWYEGGKKAVAAPDVLEQKVKLFMELLEKQRLLIPATSDKAELAWAHRSFAEYLAGRHLATLVGRKGGKGWNERLEIEVIDRLPTPESKEIKRRMARIRIGALIFGPAFRNANYDVVLEVLSQLLQVEAPAAYKHWGRELERHLFVDGPKFINPFGVTDGMIETGYVLSDIVAGRLCEGITNGSFNSDTRGRIGIVLAPLAGDNNPDLQAAVLSSLRVTSIISRGWIAGELARAASDNSPGLQSALIDALQDPTIDPDWGFRIAENLGSLASDNNPNLQAALLDALRNLSIHLDVRARIPHVLPSTAIDNNPLLQTSLLEALQNPRIHDYVRVQIARVLAPAANDNNPDIQAALLDAIQSTRIDARFRCEIPKSLTPVAIDNNAKLQAALLIVLKDTSIDADVRAFVARVLAPAARDNNPNLQAALLHAVQDSTIHSLDRCNLILRALAPGASSDNPNLQAALLKALKDTSSDADMRGCIAVMLAPGASDSQSELQGALLDALKDTSIAAHARGAIAEALAPLASDNNPNLQAALLNTLGDTYSEADERIWVAMGLRRAPAASDDNPKLKRAFLDALWDKSIHEKLRMFVAIALAPAASDCNPSVQEAVLDVLKSPIPDGIGEYSWHLELLQALTPLASDNNPNLQAALLEALQHPNIFNNFKATIIQAVASAASDDNRNVQDAVLEALTDESIDDHDRGEIAKALAPLASDSNPHLQAILFYTLQALRINTYQREEIARALAPLAVRSERVWAALLDLTRKWRKDSLTTIHAALTQPFAWERWLSELDAPEPKRAPRRVRGR